MKNRMKWMGLVVGICWCATMPWQWGWSQEEGRRQEQGSELERTKNGDVGKTGTGEVGREKAWGLDKGKLLRQETFWDNRDFAWFEEQIPFFECPDADITTTYYYRWELITKHLTYGSPDSGYSFTEFIDRPFWSGAYGAISCPAGHQLYEARWLRSPEIANDYSRYWLRTPGAQPRNYSTWLADSIWAVHQVHPDEAFCLDLLPDLIQHYAGWEARHFVPEVGLFWQTGHDDGMEFNIQSRQTQDILRGAPSYRPSFNAYMWADAMAIAKVAQLANQPEVAKAYTAKADALKAKMVALLWDAKRGFFFPAYKQDEERDGHRIQALTRTYESGQYAGDPHGRELIGYVPWQFRMLGGPSEYDSAWKKVMDRDGFYADYGPSTVERNDPMFLLQKSCCWWSGQSWPYATTQTLKGMANLLQGGSEVVTREDYVELLAIYARSHRKEGKPYLAEALHPDSGSFEGHDGYNHSEHYFHSGYCDLIITGLMGLVPRDDDGLEFRPLASAEWEYFAMDEVPYRGHRVSVVWDAAGKRYGLGAGMHVLVDGKVVRSEAKLGPVWVPGVVPVRKAKKPVAGEVERINFAVSNDGEYYPRMAASYSAPGSSVAKVHDGNYWYMQHPPNRWTCEGSAKAEDWLEVDLGEDRQIDGVVLYVLDDSEIEGSVVRAPAQVRVETWSGGKWVPVESAVLKGRIEGHRPLRVGMESRMASKVRVTLVHVDGGRSGLTEFEVWGTGRLPLGRPEHPKGNLAYRREGETYPRVAASHHDRFGGLPEKANDGLTQFAPSPMNRWTSYESPNERDWLEFDFGKRVEFRRVELAIYDDRGGVQPPVEYRIEVWREDGWRAVEGATYEPEQPVGSQWNRVMFAAVQSEKMRIVFTNRGKARSGVTEVMVWNE